MPCYCNINNSSSTCNNTTIITTTTPTTTTTTVTTATTTTTQNAKIQRNYRVAVPNNHPSLFINNSSNSNNQNNHHNNHNNQVNAYMQQSCNIFCNNNTRPTTIRSAINPAPNNNCNYCNFSIDNTNNKNHNNNRTNNCILNKVNNNRASNLNKCWLTSFTVIGDSSTQ